MAARFWVGGSGNWSDSAHWSTTTGGGGGSAKPTSSDDVTLDSNSGAAATVTIDEAANANTVTINKTDITLLHNFGSTVVGAVTLTNGTLNTNGKTCSWGSFTTASGTKTLTMGASAITVSGGGTAWNASPTSLTITANTATITISGVSAAFSSNVTDWKGASLVFTGSTNPSLLVAGTGTTFANVTRTGTAVKTDTFSLNGNIICTGTFTAGGNTVQGVNRLLVQSSTVGTQRTITAAAFVITGDVDFMDINLAYSGGASWTNAGSAFIGDALGNAGAVSTNATVSATQTATGTASFTWSTHGWTSRVPLPQDDVVISNAFVAGRTITADMPRLGRTLTCSCTGSPVFGPNLTVSIFGSLTLAAGMTTSASPIQLCGRSSHTITSNAVICSFGMTLLAFGGTYTLQDDLSLILTNATALTLGNGTFDANGKNVTCGGVGKTSSSTLKTLTLGNGGTWTLQATGTVWDIGTSPNTTFSGGNAIILIANTTNTAKTFNGGGFTYGTLRHIATGSAALTITGNNTGSLDLECTTARIVTFPAGGSWTVPSGGSLTLQGASGQLLSLVSNSPGTGTTLNIQVPWTESFTSRSADVHYVASTTMSPTQAQAPVLVRSPSPVRSPAQAGAAVLVRSPSPVRSATQSSTAALVRVAGRTVSVAQASAAALVRTPGRVLSMAQATVALVVRAPAPVRSAAQAGSAVLVRSPSPVRSATQSSTAAVVRVAGRTVSVAQASVATLVRTPGRVLAAAQAAVAVLVRSPARILNGAQAQAAALARGLSGQLSASQGQSSVLSRAPARPLSANAQPVAVVSRTPRRVLSASAGTVASVVRSVGKLLSAVQSAAASLGWAFRTPSALVLCDRAASGLVLRDSAAAVLLLSDGAGSR